MTALGERYAPDAIRPAAAVQKSGAGVPAYTRWVNRRLGSAAARTAHALGLSPNAVTLLSALLSLAGVVVLIVAEPAPATGAVIAALLAGGFVLDSADGQLARRTGRSSPAGEWLDHVVDSIRTPFLHAGVAVALLVHRPDGAGVAAVALAFSVLSSAQFLSQILAEQLTARHARPGDAPAGARSSFVLLPVDTGILCWSFVVWGWPHAFDLVYGGLFALTLIYAGVSMRRKYARLRG